MSQATGASKLIPGPLREVLLLERALEAATARSPDEASQIRELATAVDARLAAAESLAAGDQLAPALVILRDAARLSAKAVLTMSGSSVTTAGAEDNLARVAELAKAGHLPAPPEGFGAACELLASSNALVFDELPPSQAMGRRLEVEKAVTWMRGLVEARSPAQIKRSRALRLVLTGTVLLMAIVGLGAWGVSKIAAPKNIALGKVVQLSSRRPNCGAPGPEGLAPAGLVDGNKSGTYDICTNSEVSPWAVVDLAQVYVLSKAKVYNRDDCCWGQYDLPAVLEVSLDGSNYTEIARQTSSYSASKPWTVPIDGRPARFVRLRVDAREPRELVLTELELFGRPQ
jgi:F5/8 type C domain